MSTGSQQQPQIRTIEEFVQANKDKDPKVLLDLVIAESERARAEADRVMIEARNLAEIRMGANGMEATNMAGMWWMAKRYAGSDIVPDHYKRKPDNCLIACEMAQRMRLGALFFMQKSYIVHGKPGVEAQLAIAAANTSGLLAGRIHWTTGGTGDEQFATACATIKETGEVVEETITVKLAKDMGWWSKKDSLWPKMTLRMLKWRSASWLISANIPEVLMGVQTVDELEDSAAETSPASAHAPVKGLDDLTARLQQRGNGLPAEATNGNGAHIETGAATEQQSEDAAASSETEKPADANEKSEPQDDAAPGEPFALPDGLAEAIGTCATLQEVNNVAAGAAEVYGLKGAAAMAAVGEVCEQQREIIRKKRGASKQQTIDA